jgi:hypothetical protein
MEKFEFQSFVVRFVTNHGFNRTPVSFRAAKPGEFIGGAG